MSVEADLACLCIFISVGLVEVPKALLKIKVKLSELDFIVDSHAEKHPERLMLRLSHSVHVVNPPSDSQLASIPLIGDCVLSKDEERSFNPARVLGTKGGLQICLAPIQYVGAHGPQGHYERSVVNDREVQCRGVELRLIRQRPNDKTPIVGVQPLLVGRHERFQVGLRYRRSIAGRFCIVVGGAGVVLGSLQQALVRYNQPPSENADKYSTDGLYGGARCHDPGVGIAWLVGWLVGGYALGGLAGYWWDRYVWQARILMTFGLLCGAFGPWSIFCGYFPIC